MARVLERFPDTPRMRRIHAGYDWDAWFDGRVHALSADEFGGDVYVFRNSAHKQAVRRNLDLRTTYLDGEFVLQAKPIREPNIQFARIPTPR